MNKSEHSIVARAFLSFLPLILVSAQAQDAQDARPNAGTCLQCIRIRVGLARIGRGPAADIADHHFTEIQLPDGRFRGFDAHGDTRAIDGNQPWDTGGPARVVLQPGKPDEVDSCGQWLNHAELVGNTVLGWIHDETACRYQANFQTHMSTSIAKSYDYGLTWKNYGVILSGTEKPTPSKQTGEGNCTVINGEDGYYYAYCFRQRDRALIVARAPVSNPLPGNWMKYFGGKWDQPGIGGDATALTGGSGISVARWTTTGDFVFTGWVPGGMGLFFSADHLTLTPAAQPLVSIDSGGAKGSSPERMLYMDFIDAKTGSNQLSNSWLLSYAYWPPNEGRDKKYLVFRSVDVSVSKSPVVPQVGILLARWYNKGLHDHWSTTAPVPGNYTTYKLEAASGYLLTIAPAGIPSVELADCVSDRPGHPDHLIAEKGFCESHQYQRLRTAGWVYSQPQSETIPLYQCYSSQEQSHFASNRADCEKLGTNERLLGYVLSQ